MYSPTAVRFSMRGMMEVQNKSEVLDLCIRKPENESKDYDMKYKDSEYLVKDEEEYNYYNGGQIGYERDNKNKSEEKAPPVLLQQQLFRPVLSHSDPGINATMSLLQERIFTDADRSRSPTALNDSHNSNSSLRSDSPLRSPNFMSVPSNMPYATTRAGKPTRPFKAYNKDSPSLSTGEGLWGEFNEAYAEYRLRMLTQVQQSGSNGNKNMKRPVQSISPNQLPSSSGDARDQAYWERRKKNNEAAKRSRDARRAKEDELAIRAAFLEQEYVKLKYENLSLRNSMNRLRCTFCGRVFTMEPNEFFQKK